MKKRMTFNEIVTLLADNAKAYNGKLQDEHINELADKVNEFINTEKPTTFINHMACSLFIKKAVYNLYDEAYKKLVISKDDHDQIISVFESVWVQYTAVVIASYHKKGIAKHIPEFTKTEFDKYYSMPKAKELIEEYTKKYM